MNRCFLRDYLSSPFLPGFGLFQRLTVIKLECNSFPNFGACFVVGCSRRLSNSHRVELNIGLSFSRIRHKLARQADKGAVVLVGHFAHKGRKLVNTPTSSADKANGMDARNALATFAVGPVDAR